MFDPSKFTTQKSKPLPVILMLDVSGSMSGGKIEALNRAVKEMLDTFAEEEKMEIEILISIITFGEEVKLHTPPSKASQLQWVDLGAGGMTPLGAAFKIAKALVEDKQATPSHAFRPTVVLVSDGQPNDRWENPMDEFNHQGRSAKCDRMAMAIGSDADETMLKRFLTGSPHPLFYAKNAAQIYEFFQYVTMSVTHKSTNSKEPPATPKIGLDGPSTSPHKNASVDIGNNLKSAAENDQNPDAGNNSDDEGYW